MSYEVDLRDLEFQIFEWLPIEEILGSERFEDWDEATLRMVLGEALQIAREQLAPGNVEGDREGASFSEGRVKVPPVYLPAYKTLAEGGWIGCMNNPDLGGMGLPHVLGTAVYELFDGANLALSLVVMLTRGVGELIEHFASPELRDLCCEKLYSGEWTGSMCLTEPHAGSDVGASTTRALRRDDGRYLIAGEKTFITFGDHDMTENVIHAVLARLPDAPAGTRGLSLFLVPKFRILPDGTLGSPNDVRCGGIEHKLGLHGSPTCSMLFGVDGECDGYLVGEENAGLRLMFQLMNTARLEVGLEGLAVAGAAHQAALAFAKERIQGRHWSKVRDRDAPSVAIVEHPDVRRMLAASSSYVQAMRALVLKTSFLIDRAAVSEGQEQDRCNELIELLTPLCKAWCSDWGFRVTEWSLQVFGGYGYTRDYPVEQYLRDAKITSIYEGANGIQALDLVLRKLRSGGGRPLEELLSQAEQVAHELRHHDRLAAAASHLSSAAIEVRQLLEFVTKSENPTLVLLLDAVPILDMLSHTLAGSFLLEQAGVASRKLESILSSKNVDSEDRAAYLLEDREAAFYHNKVESAALFAVRALPKVRALGVAALAGGQVTARSRDVAVVKAPCRAWLHGY